MGWREIPNTLTHLIDHLHEMQRQRPRFADLKVLLELGERAGADDDGIAAGRVKRRVVQNPAQRDGMPGDAILLRGRSDCVGRFEEVVFEEPAAVQLADR
jgi:hypothetical protein